MIAGALCGWPSEDGRLDRYEFGRVVMGVPFRITLYSGEEASANAAAQAAFARVKELNALFSDYDPDSELSRLCRDALPGQPRRVSKELSFVLARSLELSKRSEGAFDVSIGPVVNLWRRARRKKALPDPEALSDALKLVGYASLRIDESAGTVSLLKPGMKLDLGGIAKGYAADEALSVLRARGVERALVAAAGDIVAGEAPPEREGWRIGIASLERPDAPPERFVLLRNAAVSTSGDAYQYIELGGRRYSHIVDPRTGIGLTRRTSVTVVAPNGITSDSLATAACILGPEAGLRLVEQTPATAALFVEMTGGGDEPDKLKTVATDSFRQFEIADEKSPATIP